MHDAVARGSLAETQKIISEESKKKLAIAKDSCGVPLLHKAVYYDQPEIVAWLIENYPIAPQQKDRVRRFPPTLLSIKTNYEKFYCTLNRFQSKRLKKKSIIIKNLLNEPFS